MDFLQATLYGFYGAVIVVVFCLTLLAVIGLINGIACWIRGFKDEDEDE